MFADVCLYERMYVLIRKEIVCLFACTVRVNYVVHLNERTLGLVKA